MTRSHQPKPPAVAIVRQNGLSSASSRASVTDTPVSRQIWWTQVVDGWPQACLHSCKGRSPSLVWCWFKGSGLPEHHFEVWRHDQRDPVFVYRRCMRRQTGRYGAKLHRWDTKSCQLMCRMRRWQNVLKNGPLSQNIDIIPIFIIFVHIHTVCNFA